MKTLIVSTLLIIAAMALAIPAFAQDPETLVVTPGNLRGWSSADTRPGGTSGIVADPNAISGNGSLSLTTNATTAAKAQFMHPENTPLSSVTSFGYSAKQNSASFPGGTASYQLAVNLCGPTTGFTTFVYEPYENGGVVPGTWQTYNASAGQMWSSRSVTCGDSSVTAGGGGAPFYTLAQLQASFPNAVVVGIGANVGSNNPSYNISVDLISFNNVTYDFEKYSYPQSADDCKKGAWSTYEPSFGPFKNQGACVSWAEHNVHAMLVPQPGRPSILFRPFTVAVPARVWASS